MAKSSFLQLLVGTLLSLSVHGFTSSLSSSKVCRGLFATASTSKTTTSSGLEYVDLVVGDGKQPGKNDFVSVHYEGKLKKSGKVFGSTISEELDERSEIYKGTPFQFPLGRGKVIPGWEEGIASMKIGGKRRLFVPSALAYGEKGSPDGVIQPGADLIFDVELVSVDGSMDAAGGLGLGFSTALGLIAANGLTQLITGHELREYLNGSMNL